nr:hypothetical protein Iba_chr03cCG9730 [Ipomoea batatas]
MEKAKRVAVTLIIINQKLLLCGAIKCLNTLGCCIAFIQCIMFLNDDDSFSFSKTVMEYSYGKHYLLQHPSGWEGDKK